VDRLANWYASNGHEQSGEVEQANKKRSQKGGPAMHGMDDDANKQEPRTSASKSNQANHPLVVRQSEWTTSMVVAPFAVHIERHA
jgi:hypothetical protein